MQRTTIRYTAPAAAALVAGTLLVGCSGADDPPDTSPTTGTSSTSSGTTGATTTTPSTPTTAAVVVPPEATKHTEEGAKAFVSFFVAEMGRSAYEADSSVIAALSGRECQGCKTLIRLADDFKAAGQHVNKPSVHLAGQIVRPDSRADQYVIDALVQVDASTVVDSKNATVSMKPAEKLTFRNTVSWASGRWVMSQNLLVK